MHTDWAAECGTDDPLIVVPWRDPNDTSGKCAFVDLRAQPEEAESLPEAEQHPPLARALRALNASRSPVFTSKCDAWTLSTDEVAQLRLELALDRDGEEQGEAGEEPALTSGFASYIDCICRDRALFASFPRHEHVLRRIARLAARLDHPHAALECVLRPAFLHLDSPRQGFAISFYVKALGNTAPRAEIAWAAALAEAVAVLRRSDVFR